MVKKIAIALGAVAFLCWLGLPSVLQIGSSSRVSARTYARQR
jgi:hypothetical protein